MKNLEYFSNRNALEIGGPTQAFNNLYRHLAVVDCVQIHTSIPKGESAPYDFLPGKKGIMYSLDGTDLSLIPNDVYTAILSSHNLEHIANPIKALKEWVRVAKHESYIYIVVPKKETCFDHRRPTTTFDHILDDYNKNVGEDDQTHTEEIISLHDRSRNIPRETTEQLRHRAETNGSHRQMHLHIFDDVILSKTFEFLNIEKMYIEHDNHNWYSLGKIIK